MDIEHALKTSILRDFNTLGNNGEDIVNSFLESNEGQSTKGYLESDRGDRSVSNKLINNNRPQQMPFWVLVEVILNFYFHRLNLPKISLNSLGLNSP